MLGQGAVGGEQDLGAPEPDTLGHLLAVASGEALVLVAMPVARGLQGLACEPSCARTHSHAHTLAHTEGLSQACNSPV